MSECSSSLLYQGHDADSHYSGSADIESSHGARVRGTMQWFPAAPEAQRLPKDDILEDKNMVMLDLLEESLLRLRHRGSSTTVRQQ